MFVKEIPLCDKYRRTYYEAFLSKIQNVSTIIQYILTVEERLSSMVLCPNLQSDTDNSGSRLT